GQLLRRDTARYLLLHARKDSAAGRAALVEHNRDRLRRPSPYAGDAEPTRAPETPPAVIRAPSPDRRAFVRTAGARTLAELIGVAREDVDHTRPFGELGLDSVLMLEFRRRLERVFERAVPAPALFNHPTVDALAAFLLDANTSSEARPNVRATPSRPSPEVDRVAVVGVQCRF